MVKIGKRVKVRLLKSMEKWEARASLRDNGFYEVGACDICTDDYKLRLKQMERWFPNRTWTEGDPPWLFCEEHARELGVIW